jgi:uncharacterized protein YbjQ (UPF0145 family)
MPEDAIAFACPHCSQPLEAPGELRGTAITCPNCQQTMQIPALPAEPTPAEAEIAPAPDDGIDPVLQQSLQRPSLRQIIVTTGPEISGRPVERYLGIARGIVVRSPKPGEAFVGGLENFFGGGNNDSYTRVCEAARQEAFNRMLSHAGEMAAQAVIAFRYDATEFSPGLTEVIAYGTAVTLSI